MKDTSAIVVAGGKGLRFGGRVRKQYLRLKGRPVLWWSLAALEKSPSISSITLVVPLDDVATLQKLSKYWRFKKLTTVVAGGSTRADSVRHGLRSIPWASRYVAVHDAVRPLITPALVESVIRAARKSRAALAACPSKDTVKISNTYGVVIDSPARERVWLAHTPQVFERKLLERAHRSGHKQVVTDDAQLVERLGARVQLVLSPPENIKVTVPMDLVMAQRILGERS